MDPIFNMFKIKYADMAKLIPIYCKELKRDSKVNVFINFEPILKYLSIGNANDYIKVSDNSDKEMISNIINMMAHYRQFFTKHKLYSKVYLYIPYPFNKVGDVSSVVYPNYRDNFKSKFVKNSSTKRLVKCINENMEIIKTISEHIEGCYIITSESIENSLVPFIINKENSNPEEVNFIVTSEPYEYQYVNHGFYILRPSRNADYMISKYNLIDTIKMEQKLFNNEIEVNPNAYEFILSILGDKTKNIEKIKKLGLASILKLIDKGIKENKISKIFTIEDISKFIREEYKDILFNNYMVSSIEMQYKLLNTSNKFSILSQIKERFDNVGLKKINDEYFQESPLQVLELTGGTPLKHRNKNIF